MTIVKQLTINTDPVITVNPERDSEWDTLALRNAGRVTHAYDLGAWKEIHRRAYGIEPIYLAVRGRSGGLVAGMPLVIQGGRLRGLAARLQPRETWASAGFQRRLSSLIRGGPMGTDAHGRAVVLASACRLVDEGTFDDLRILTGLPGCDEWVSGLRVVPHWPTWVTALPQDPEELQRAWRKESKNLSRNVIKAEQRGTVVREVQSCRDLWRFYRQYVRTMQRHKAVPRSWLEIWLAHRLLAPVGRCRVWVGDYRGRVVAGAMFLSAGTTLELLYSGSDRRADSVRPTHAIYWHAITWAIASGMTALDWGAAPPESSLGKFKRQWSAEPVDQFLYLYSSRETSGRKNANGRATSAEHPRDSGTPVPRSSSSTQRSRKSATAWNHIPVDALGLAATIAHRVL